MSRSQTNNGPIPDLAKFGRFRAKQPFTESFAGPGPRFSKNVIFVLSGPFQRASKGQDPELAKLSYFCIKRPFTESLKGPGPRFGKICLFLR